VGASPHPPPHNTEATTMILSKMTIKDVGYAKKKMHTQRRYATCLGMSKKKRKDSPLSKKKEKRDGA